MRENRTCGSEGGEGFALPDPYQGEDMCGISATYKPSC